jgi:hypothetical protein
VLGALATNCPEKSDQDSVLADDWTRAMTKLDIIAETDPIRRVSE